MELKQIGVVKHTSRGTVIKIDAPYLKGLVGLGGFGHINVLWWFSNCDNPQSRSIVTLDRPYRNAPETIGVFASRSPERPNPIALTTSEVLGIDYEQGEIFVDFINAEDGSPVLDIKPYIPSFDRIEHPAVPKWQSGEIYRLICWKVGFRDVSGCSRLFAVDVVAY